MGVELSVELKGVSFGYGATRIFEDLEWQVTAGEFHAVLGASGSGKTTLLRLIAGLEHPQSGGVWFDGRQATSIPSHLRGISLVDQSAATYEHLTVAENLRLAERLAPLKSTGMQEELVRQFGLSETLARKPSQLSGGQLQRLAIVRALLNGRSILLMDEPLAHLQESLRSPIRRLLKGWQQERKLTCIYVTHDSQEACQVADRVSILGERRVLQTDNPENVYRRPSCRVVAELLGRPSVQWVPSSVAGEVVGLRPMDWELVSEDNSGRTSEGVFDVNNDRVRVVGRLSGIQQVESVYWLDVHVAEHRLLVVLQSPVELQVNRWVELVNASPIWIDR